MKRHFYFGEKIKEYNVRVLNERELRAGAGILFFFAIIASISACTLGNLFIIKLFIITFLIDFIIRVVINPKYAPSLTLGRLFISNQKPEYVGAPQKRFARSIGLILSIIMFWGVVVNSTIGTINIVICFICLLFLFFESSFGICIGCHIYNLFNKEKAKLCPGGVCEITKKEAIQKTNRIQILILVLTIGGLFAIASTKAIQSNKTIQPCSIQNTNNNQETGYTKTCLFNK